MTDTCSKGHSVTDESTYWVPSTGQPQCRLCRKERAAAYYKRTKAPGYEKRGHTGRLCSRCHHPGHAENRCINGDSSRLCVRCGRRCEPFRGELCGGCRDGRPGHKECGYCGGRGHNVRTCAAALANPERVRLDYEGQT